MPPARHGVYSQLSVPLCHLQIEAVKAAAVAPIHPFPQTAVVGVAVVVGVVGGVGVGCGLLIGAVHAVIPFRWLNDIIVAWDCQHFFHVSFGKFLTRFDMAGRPEKRETLGASVQGSLPHLRRYSATDPVVRVGEVFTR